ncbi:MAG: hypothetical protein ACK4SQ_15975 [Allorhizobium sp.]
MSNPNAETVFRDFDTDGVPSSGKRNPKKREIRQLLKGYESLLTTVGTAANVFLTRADLFATLTRSANTLAWVVSDTTAAYNGIYMKSGASGSGSWSRVADLPYSFIRASDEGAGTANAIQATTSVPVSESALIIMNVFEANTATPVTVSFNGDAALTIKSNSGEDVEVGGLTAGMLLTGYISGSTFRLANDETVAARIYAARDATFTARDRAQDWAEKATDSPVVTGQFSAKHHATKAAGSAAAALASQGAAAASQTAASVSATQAALNAIASGSTLYDTEANGRAASTNGQVFRVAVAPGVQAWRRDSAGASTFLGWIGEVIFNDVASLLSSSFSGLETGQIVRTRREGYVYTVAASGASDHDVTTAGSVKLYVNRFADDYVTLEMFGARGDNATDDTAAFYKAASKGLPIRLGSKTYYLPNVHTQSLPANLSISGAGAKLSKLRGAMVWPVSSPNLAQNCFNVVDQAVLYVNGIGFSNFGQVFRINNSVSEIRTDVVSIEISDCEFSNCYMPLAVLRSFYNVSINRLVLSGNHVHDCETGFDVFAAVSSAQVSENVIEDLRRTHNAGASLHQRCQGVQILYTGGGTEESELSIGDIHISNNVVRRLRSELVGDSTSGHGDVNAFIVSGTRITIEANSVFDLTSAQGINTEGIYTKGRDVVISGNTLVNAGAEQGAINCKRSDFVRSNCIVTDNTVRFTNDYSAAVASSGSNGIRNECDSVTISGNRFIGTTGIAISDASGNKEFVSISGNYIEISAGLGIVAASNASLYTINDNKIVGRGINLPSSEVVLIRFGATLLEATPNEISLQVHGNLLEFDASCTLNIARLFALIRNTKLKSASIKNNVLSNRAVATTKRWFNVQTRTLGSADAQMELLAIEGNDFLPLGSNAGEMLSMALTGMNGTLVIANNRGFVTENEASLASSSTTPAISHGLTPWSGITGASGAAPPARCITVTPLSSLGAAKYAFVSSVTNNIANLTLDAAPGATVTIGIRAVRQREVISA